MGRQCIELWSRRRTELFSGRSLAGCGKGSNRERKPFPPRLKPDRFAITCGRPFKPLRGRLSLPEGYGLQPVHTLKQTRAKLARILQNQRRTSGAKALVCSRLCGTAEAVP